MGSKVFFFAIFLAYFREVGALGDFPQLHYFRKCEIKILVWYNFSILTVHNYWDATYAYIDKTWACTIQLWPVFGLERSNKIIFESIADL